MEKLLNIEVRIIPILVALLIFVLLSVLQRLVKPLYVPSYFFLFPMSALDEDIARLYGEGMYVKPLGNEIRKIRRLILFKSTVTVVIALMLIPGFVGLISALLMNSTELAVLLIIFVLWQGYSAFQSVMDNVNRVVQKQKSTFVLSAFYVLYLVLFSGCLWYTYNFARPFATRGEFVELFSAVIESIFSILLFGILIGVIGNIIAHFVTDQEMLIGEEPKDVSTSN
jgi:hypothetical protein